MLLRISSEGGYCRLQEGRMAEPAGQQNTTSPSRRVRMCRASLTVLGFVWTTLIVGIGGSTIANLNTTTIGKTGETGTSLTDVLSKLFFVQLIYSFSFPIFFSLGFLVLLTLLSWLGSHEKLSELLRFPSLLNRTHMLGRLHLRYEELLAQPLQEAVRLELRLSKRPAAVQNTASLLLRQPNKPEQLLDPHTSIIQAYEHLGQQELLILGEPGAGKSTQLLILAKHLLEQAKQDATQPLPFVLPLSTWATRQLPLRDWLIEQVALLYKIDQRESRRWLQAEWVLPLLDGLDEVEGSKRPACISAINTYHQEHVQPLVVCSRTNEYEAASTHERLELHTAVVVQPLSPEQVQAYLEEIGSPVEALRSALKKNAELAELVTTPLMLQVLILTYHDVEVYELSQKEAQLQQQIWTDYVEHMVNLKGDLKHYPLNIIRARLSWQAKEMRAHNWTIFLVEQLGLDWLPKGKRPFYRWSMALIFGLGGVLVGGLAGGLGNALVNGLLFALGGVLIGGESDVLRNDALTFWLIFGLLNGLLSGLRSGPVAALVGGLIFGLVGWLIFDLVDALNREQVGRPAHWLVGRLIGVLVGLAIGLTFGLPAALFSGIASWRTSGLGVGVTFWLVFGLAFGLISARGAQGKEWAGRLVRGLIVGLVYGLIGGLVLGMVGPLISGFISGRASGLGIELIFGLLGGLVCGLGGIVRHFTLRFWLWQARCTPAPWQYTDFFGDATNRILLRRVGGGYQFAHRLLLDYFADLEAPAPLPPTAESSTSLPTT